MAISNNATATKVGKDGAIELGNDDSDQEEEEDDGWGDDWGAAAASKVAENFDYSKTNLNKLSNTELALHKKKMDEKFSKNQLKPGDNGFQYDKRIDFTKKAESNKKGDTSWDEEEDVDNYFDDDFM